MPAAGEPTDVTQHERHDLWHRTNALAVIPKLRLRAGWEPVAH